MTTSHRYLRYIPLALLGFVVLHFISFPLRPPGTGNFERDISTPQFNPVDTSGPHSTVFPSEPSIRANATFVTLARNKDLGGIIHSIKHVEERFNQNYHYDWVFLNDHEFDEEFMKKTTAAVSGNTFYGLIPEEHWSYPDWIDKEKAAAARKDMKERKIIYGGSASYRHMCRYESGFFFRHPLMLNYDYYWRVEPNVEYHCDVPYDPFKVLRDNGKKYSFVISLHEYEKTIPTLWDSTKRFMANHTQYIVEGNSLDFISNDGGDSYNLCHFWSNFEIGDLNWLRSQPYLDYFNHLDQEGGFFYERWGDAPVHSIAASLMLKKEEIHFFDDIAYTHRPFTHCPTSRQKQIDLRCSCNDKMNFDWKAHSCTSRFFDVNNMPRPRGYMQQTEWFATLVKVFWFTVLALSIVTGICTTPFVRRRIIAFAHPLTRVTRDELFDWRWAKS